MADVFLETDRLILRRFSESDIGNIYELDNDPDVMRYINGGIPTPWNVIEHKIFPGFLYYDPKYPGYGFWAIDEKKSGKFLGWLSYRPVDQNPAEVSLGFRLRKDAWGKGYATEGAQALIHKGFTELGVQRLVAKTYEDNLASRRVMEKIGMKFSRFFRVTAEDLERSDTFHVDGADLWEGQDVEYVLEKSDWESIEKSRS